MSFSGALPSQDCEGDCSILTFPFLLQEYIRVFSLEDSSRRNISRRTSKPVRQLFWLSRVVVVARNADLFFSPTDCWGFAIVLGVNILVFPISSEYQLRELLVLSLEHVSTFAHLIAKTYDLQISDEERVVRDALNQTVRTSRSKILTTT